MNETNRQIESGNSKFVQFCVVIFLVVGIVAFQIMAPQWFPKKEEGINYERTMWAAIIGGGSALLGMVIGKGIELLLFDRSKK